MSTSNSTTNLNRTTSAVSGGPKPRKNYIGRSQSFAGFGVLTPKRMESPGTAWARPVLGDLMRSPKLGRRANISISSPSGSNAKSLVESFKKAGLKLPKVPRPQRTIAVFQSLKRGIKDCIQSTEDDLVNLRLSDHAIVHSTAQAKSIEIEKQIRAAERYRKRLEFHLSKVDELEEQYFIHQQLREGVKTMAKAYVHHTGESKKESLNNVKTGFKECTQILCAIEAQLENLMGTFHCQIKGLLGFARLMPGDVYEITLRHGHQKWKSRGRIGDAKQSWDTHTCVFKALLADMLNVKAVEVKILGKHSLLGEKHCETRDLFSSHPQLMTVAINPHGTIKMSIYVTWNPLEGVDETMNVFEPIHRTPSLKRTSYPVIEGYHFAYMDGNESLSASSSDLSYTSGSSLMGSPSPSYFRHSTSAHTDLAQYARPSTDFQYGRSGTPNSRPVSIAVMDTINETAPWDGYSDFGVVKPDVFDTSALRDSLDADLCRTGYECTSGHVAGLHEAVTGLKSVLEDYQGQYDDLRALEEHVHTLYAMIEGGNVDAQSPHGSITIETALEAFDFLESDEYYHDGYGSASGSRHPSLDHLEQQCTLSPESTTKTADSGIESIANRLSEDEALERQFGASPEPVTTGNDQVDVALLWHLAYCERLLENLGNFGPLKCREIYSLDRLKRQADILCKLIVIAKRGPNVGDLQQLMSEPTQSKELRQFWVRCVDGPVLYVSIDRFFAQLERSYGDVVRERYDIDSMKVFEIFVCRMLDYPIYDSRITRHHPNVTMYQLLTYMVDEQDVDIREYFQQLAGELWLSTRLKCTNTDIVIKTMLTFKKEAPPTADCLRIIGLLLITDNSDARRSAASFIRSLNTYATVRDKVLVVYVESLEDRNPDMRCASCIALRLLQASEAMKQLVYLSQADSSTLVKHTAKDALLSFDALGEEGRKAYEESQLSCHGFQGVKVRL